MDGVMDRGIVIKTECAMPFYSQLADFNGIDSHSFKTMADAEYWGQNGCGIASIRMVIDGFQNSRGLKPCESYGALVYRGLEIGAYCPKGWIHSGLVKIASEYGVIGKTHRDCSIKDVQKQIENGNPCIVSVSPLFEGGMVDEHGCVIPKGGHLVVFKGVVLDNREAVGFIVNYPSSKAENNRENFYVSAEKFKNSFSGSFMSFWV